MSSLKRKYICATRRRHSGQEGFVLPLAVILVVLLAVSGASFMQLDFQEKRMAMNEVDNHGSFYLASAGIERARETLKMPGSDWTSVLSDNPPAPYAHDFNPDPLLCPDPSRGCVILPFQTTAGNPVIANDGDPVNAQDQNFPFDNTFDDGEYSARAFNNEAGTVDTDQRLTVRALGTVRGEQKLLELKLMVDSNLNLMNCVGEPGDPCPNSEVGNSVEIEYSPGKEPAATPTLPAMDPPLSDPDNFFRDPDNLTGLTLTNVQILSGDITLTTSPNPNKPAEVLMQNNSYYQTNGNITVRDTASGANGNSQVVVFSTGGSVELRSGTLTDAILIGVNEVSVKGSSVLSAPLPYPAIIAGSAVGGDNGVTIYGTIYAEGEIDLQPISVHGVLIGQSITLQGSGYFTDDGNLDFYALMPGFDYPNELKTMIPVPGPDAWQEIEVDS